MKKIIKKLLVQNQLVLKFCRSMVDTGAFPAGHFYSPIPDEKDVMAYVERGRNRNSDLLDIDMNHDQQMENMESFFSFYQELPFESHKKDGLRYYYENEMFSYGDAVFLHCFLRNNQPKRIIEVGSGFSSAAMLDTIDRFFPDSVEIKFIEPYPQRLNELLLKGDDRKCQVIEKKVQDVPIDEFMRLDSSDLLFIDSSHVVKCGSDLHYLLFEVLPRLKTGVFVHFHDIFYPFEYPEEWLKKRIYWNENYFIRAFLANNCRWNIYFFNDYLARVCRERLEEKMPICLKNPGGGLYLRKVPA